MVHKATTGFQVAREMIMKTTTSTADLSTKTCKRGHMGEYFRQKNGSSVCRACTKGAMARYRGVEEAKISRMKESSQERFAELESLIPKLRLGLELAEAEYEFLSKQLVILGVSK